MHTVSAKRYRQLLDQVNDAVYTVDLSTFRFTFVNPAAGRLTGYTAHELSELNFSQIVTQESLDLVRKMIAQKISADVATIYEIEILRKDGRRVPVEISSRAVYADGKPVEILGVARDITERKKLEKQREIFVSLVSHEIKNPLTAIKSFVEIWRRKFATDEKTDEQFVMVRKQLNKINRLMSDFLEVSRIELGMFSIERETFDLDLEIDDIIESYSTAKHAITREGRIGIPVLGDKDRIAQVLINLISNAIRYSPEADKVVVSTVRNDTAVVVKVRDFGMGISTEDCEKVFELFYRAASATKSIKGHGLGLFICREIIRAHGGEIGVESVVGKGSTFYFTLPL